MARSRASQRAAAALGLLAVALFGSPAAANGRFPRAQRLIQDQANPDVLALYGTYGLLVTRDAGASWRHVCEAATGLYSGEDSLLEIMADERLVVRTDTGLVRSDASFCNYDAVLDSADDALQDITRDSASPDGLLALATRFGDNGVIISHLSASTDGGRTFTPLASVPADVLRLGLTLDVAPRQPEVIYISGFDEQGGGRLAQSTNRGQSFVGFPISGLAVAATPYIAAVSALDPRRVFVRTDEVQRSNDFEARETANDALYFTPDGGESWHQALRARGRLLGFALSPDEHWVLAGYGDPVLAASFVEPDDLGLYRVALDDLVASPDAPPWERIYAASVTCLRWTANALFVCLSQDQSGFELGRAPDASFSLADAAPFEPLLRLPEVRPLECPAASGGAACLLPGATGWTATCSVLRAQCSLDAGKGDGQASNPTGTPSPAGSAGQPAGGGAPGVAAGNSTPPASDSSSPLALGDGTSAAVDAAGARAPDPSGAAAPAAAGSPPAGSSCSAVPRGRGTGYGHSSAGWIVALLSLAARALPARSKRRVA